MPTLFEPTSINGMELPNRFVRSATWEGLAAEDGSFTPPLGESLARLAAGGVGLVIPGYAFVSREGQDAPGQLGVHSDAMLPGLTEMAAAVHASGGRIALQLAHAGLDGDPELSGHEPAGPSPLLGPGARLTRAMDAADLAAVTRAFAEAAARARRAGCDAVQIHAAHGYLLSQFLSPRFNRRRDGYGGGVERRARLLLEVLEAVRAAVGPNYPVLVKINAEDFVPGGLSVDDMLAVVELLEAAGCDAVELSGGTGSPEGISFSRVGRPAPGEPEAYYESAALRFKKSVAMPLILVGGIRTFETATRLVAEGVTDYIALSRPLIREPDLVARWRSGDTRPARCVSDNACFDSPDDGHGLFCVVEARRK